MEERFSPNSSEPLSSMVFTQEQLDIKELKKNYEDLLFTISDIELRIFTLNKYVSTLNDFVSKLGDLNKD